MQKKTRKKIIHRASKHTFPAKTYKKQMTKPQNKRKKQHENKSKIERKQKQKTSQKKTEKNHSPLLSFDEGYRMMFQRTRLPHSLSLLSVFQEVTFKIKKSKPINSSYF